MCAPGHSRVRDRPPESSVKSEPSLIVGQGDGDAGTLTVTGGTLALDHVEIAELPGSFGGLTIGGADAALNSLGNINVGRQGVGLLELHGGASALAFSAAIGAGEGATGHALIDDGSLLDVADPLTVGKIGLGTLEVRGGGQVFSGSSSIALEQDGLGGATVHGPDSLWMISGSLDVGMRGVGALSVEDGAAVTTESFLVIGNTVADEWSAYGQVVVRGEGSMLSVGGALRIGLISTGELHVENGARVIVAGDLHRNGASEHRIVLSEASTQYSTAGGGPAMDIAGSVVNLGVEIALADGYVPDAGDSFHLMSFSGVQSVSFVDLPELPEPLTWSQQLDTSGLTITVLGESVPGDLNGDSVVNVFDLLVLLGAWGDCDDPGDCPADLSGDGAVNIFDLLQLLGAWT